MKDQHKKITGYRDLSKAEIALMNRIKAKGNELGALVAELEAKHKKEAEGAGRGTMPMGEFEKTIPQLVDAMRWTSIGKTHLQQGLMALTRAVARPESF